MQTVIALITYVITTVTFQSIGFLISRLVNYNYPTLGMMTFLILFLCSFWAAWPVAVRIAEWIIVRLGFKLENDQSGGSRRRDTMESYRQDQRDASK